MWWENEGKNQDSGNPIFSEKPHEFSTYSSSMLASLQVDYFL